MNSKLIELAVWLRANPVPNLDMRNWKGVNECGTTHCIMGWVAANKQFGFYLNAYDGLRHIDVHPDYDSWQAICHGLDIYEQTAECLFFSEHTKGMSFDEIVNQIEHTGKSWELDLD